MAVSATPQIRPYDRVVVTQATEGIPAGAEGGVIELRDSGNAMVEITDPVLDAVDRIVFVPLAHLRKR